MASAVVSPRKPGIKGQYTAGNLHCPQSVPAASRFSLIAVTGMQGFGLEISYEKFRKKFRKLWIQQLDNNDRINIDFYFQFL
jgi:hypothetical protein